MYDRRVLTRLLALAALLLGAGSSASARAQTPPIKHVFVIVLENENADTSFGPSSPAPYLAKELTRRGEYLPNYYAIGHVSLPNYIAMISGQSPNLQTQSDCQFYTSFLPGTIGPAGQALGSGCVYPAPVKTVADQLTGAGLTWKGYMEDMGADVARDKSATCAHPSLNSRDGTQSAAADDQYATRHNPFVYFQSITGTPACAADDVPLSRLSADLASDKTTPSFSFITPDLCHDGHDAKCADGGPGGLPAADSFLKTWVPKITASPAFRDGLLMVTFDESANDSTACCGEPSGPNSPSPGGLEAGPGGGKIGAVLLSPYVKPGSTNQTAYNHYSMLRSVEDLFALPHLGDAGAAGLRPFGADVYNGAPAPRLTRLTLAPRSFAPASTSTRASGRASRLARGTTIRFTLDRAATVRLLFTKLTRTAHPAARARAITRVAHSGRNTVRFTGRLGGTALTAGRWRVQATPAAAGATTKAVSVTQTFTVLRG
jgi:hypothetical protein